MIMLHEDFIRSTAQERERYAERWWQSRRWRRDAGHDASRDASRDAGLDAGPAPRKRRLSWRRLWSG